MARAKWVGSRAAPAGTARRFRRPGGRTRPAGGGSRPGGAGQPWLVAIEGDPGVGKTALVRRCLAEAAGLRVLQARASLPEADLDFGIVDQLLRPAGEAVLTAETGAPTSSFAVGARLLEVVGEQLATGALAIVIDDLQWADRKSAEALTFMLRRLSVDPVLAIMIYRRPGDLLDEPAQRMLASVENRLQITLDGLTADEVASLAAALRTESLDEKAIQGLYRRTGGHPLYLRTVLSEESGSDPGAPGRQVLPRSLAAAIGDRLAGLPADTRTILEMLSVLNLRLPLAQLGQAAEIESPSAAIEPAVTSGLVDWSPEEPSCPVVLRHPLVRDAIYAGITATRRCALHARAASVVTESASWEHRVAALDRPDEDLAAQLERLAGGEAAAGRLALSATHLQWASDISPARADREQRLLTAALQLMLAEESRGLAMREAVEAAAPSSLRSCVLGTMAFSSGQLAEAERQFSEALAEARDDPDRQPLAAMIANRLAGTYTLLGDGEQVMTFGRWALGTGCLDAAAASQTRTLIAIGASRVAGHMPPWPNWSTSTPIRPALARSMSTGCRSVGLPAASRRPGPGHLRPDRQREAGPPGRHHHARPARLRLPGAGPVPGRRVGRRAAHRRAGVLRGRDPYPALRASAAAPGGGLRADRAGRGRGGRAARPPRRGGGRQPGLRPGEAVRGHGPGPGVPGGRRLPGHGRRAGPLAGRRGPGRPEPGVRGLVAAAADRGPGRLGSDGAGRRRPGPAARGSRRGWLPAAGPGLAGRVAGRAAGRPGGSPADLLRWRGVRQHAEPGLCGPAAAGPRPPPAADGPAAPGGRAAAAGVRLVPCAARRAVHRPGRRGAGGLSLSR
jgi:hypothetical protein